MLAADQAFFNALQAQALLKVADQNVSTRATTQTQVNQMTKNKLKSTLDLSFANVNVVAGEVVAARCAEQCRLDHGCIGCGFGS